MCDRECNCAAMDDPRMLSPDDLARIEDESEGSATEDEMDALFNHIEYLEEQLTVATARVSAYRDFVEERIVAREAPRCTGDWRLFMVKV